MATTPDIPAGDRRRGSRAVLRLPVLLTGVTRTGKQVSTKGETIVVSRNGALLKAEDELKPGSEVKVENLSNQQAGQFHVVWTSDQPTHGRWEVGLESRSSTPNIWGVEFAPEM